MVPERLRVGVDGRICGFDGGAVRDRDVTVALLGFEREIVAAREPELERELVDERGLADGRDGEALEREALERELLDRLLARGEPLDRLLLLERDGALFADEPEDLAVVLGLSARRSWGTSSKAPNRTAHPVRPARERTPRRPMIACLISVSFSGVGLVRGSAARRDAVSPAPVQALNVMIAQDFFP
jgi:hypothetical protein